MTQDCRTTALRYLEIKERSAIEVKSHLIAKGFSEEEIETEMNFLEELKYLDDERFCSNYIQYGLSKGRGPVRLQQELSEKGIDSSMIRESLEEIFDRRAERETALKEAKKQLRQKQSMFVEFPGSSSGNGDIDSIEEDEAAAEGPDEKTLARIGRKLNSLGYHSDIIYDVLRTLRKP